MLSEVSSQRRVQFPSLPPASAPLAQCGGLPPVARDTHSCCYPSLLRTRPAKSHVLSTRITPLAAPSCHATARFAPHVLIASQPLLCIPCRGRAAGHNTAQLFDPGQCCLQHRRKTYGKCFCLFSTPNSTSLMLTTPCLSPLQN